jgi:RsmE family RNA methyltransferase
MPKGGWFMNRILLREEEMDESGVAHLSGRRARHVFDVLHGKAGQTLKIGVLDGPRGTGLIQEAGKDRLVVQCRFDADLPPLPRVDVLLALPRPKAMKRLWAPLASMGVGHLCLVNAEKVERDYFDTHWLEPAHYTPLLVEGLEQAGDTRLPKVTIVKRLKPFLEDELDSMFVDSRRLIAHPGEGSPVWRIPLKAGQRILLAVGPEGGWTDFELRLFDRCGFTKITMGRRTLRVDTACVALLAIVNSHLA